MPVRATQGFLRQRPQQNPQQQQSANQIPYDCANTNQAGGIGSIAKKGHNNTLSPTNISVATSTTTTTTTVATNLQSTSDSSRWGAIEASPTTIFSSSQEHPQQQQQQQQQQRVRTKSPFPMRRFFGGGNGPKRSASPSASTISKHHHLHNHHGMQKLIVGNVSAAAPPLDSSQDDDEELLLQNQSYSSSSPPAALSKHHSSHSLFSCRQQPEQASNASSTSASFSNQTALPSTTSRSISTVGTNRIQVHVHPVGSARSSSMTPPPPLRENVKDAQRSRSNQRSGSTLRFERRNRRPSPSPAPRGPTRSQQQHQLADPPAASRHRNPLPERPVVPPPPSLTASNTGPSAFQRGNSKTTSSGQTLQSSINAIPSSQSLSTATTHTTSASTSSTLGSLITSSVSQQQGVVFQIHPSQAKPLERQQDPPLSNNNNNNTSRKDPNTSLREASPSLSTSSRSSTDDGEEKKVDNGRGDVNLHHSKHESKRSEVASMSWNDMQARTDPKSETGNESKMPPARGGVLPTTAALRHHGPTNHGSTVVRSLLSRPFGRTNLPPSIARKWVIEVSSAEWDADEQRWKYRILVQQRQTVVKHKQQQQSEASIRSTLSSSSSSSMPETEPLQNAGATGAVSATSFTTAFTWRSLADFIWLERELRWEFQGGLLLPDLSIALGRPADTTLNDEGPVEAEKLRHWLSDVFNGVRGQGEIVLDYRRCEDRYGRLSRGRSPRHPEDESEGDEHDTDDDDEIGIGIADRWPIDLLRSDAMETFLYKNTGPLALDDGRHPSENTHKNHPMHGDATSPMWRILNQAGGAHKIGCGPERYQSFQRSGRQQEDADFSSLVWPLAMLASTLELCIGPEPAVSARTSLSSSYRGGGSYVATPPRSAIDVLTCSSRALGSAPSFDVQDSFADWTVPSLAGTPRASCAVAIHSELIEAEHALVLNYRRTALCVLDQIQTLQQAEERVGSAWKRLSVALSNLFSYEKDVEHARLGDSKVKRELIPYRRISKSAVDDGLRVLARQYMDRSIPALAALHEMTSAYVADLSAVSPSVQVYIHAIIQMSHQQREDDTDDESQTPSQGGGKDTRTAISGRWDDRLRNLANTTLHDVKRTVVASLGSSVLPSKPTGPNSTKRSIDETIESDERRRFIENEALLRESLTTMCRLSLVRLARIAWRYWSIEASQCALLHSAAGSLRAKFEASTHKDSISKMWKRHALEEKEDDCAEIDLVRRIVSVGNKLGNDDADQSHSQSTGVDSEGMDREKVDAIRRDKAVSRIRGRIGRWDAAAAMALMQAVGVEDPNVRVEETTRELRLVRKYAVGLREHWQRCLEAWQWLHDSIMGTSSAQVDSRGSSPNPGPPSNQPTSNQADDYGQECGGMSIKHSISEYREELLAEASNMFSGSFVERDRRNDRARRSMTASTAILSRVGVETNDPFGWNRAAKPMSHLGTVVAKGRVGDWAVAYHEARHAKIAIIVKSVKALLTDYAQRIEAIESFVYMECVGIQLEKHFSALRTQALASFEKKADITNAITIATRKRLPKLLKELQAKLEALGPDVSHTTVKETKEAHLESKNIKIELHELAMRRLMRAREASTEKVVVLMSRWAKEEEHSSAGELKILSDAIGALERAVGQQRDLCDLLQRSVTPGSSINRCTR